MSNPHAWRVLVEVLIKSGILIGGLMTAAAYLVLVERWIAAWVQDRLGPNRVGIPLTRIRLFGLGQPIADGIKFLTKEEFTPAHVDKLLYFAAPIAMFVSALAVFAVIPFGSVDLGFEGFRDIPLVVAPRVDVGMVYVFAVAGIGVYGVVLGGWASNNKYSVLGGLRSSAQLISYEIPVGLGILGVVLVSGSLRLETIITGQAQSGVWNVMTQPLGFVVFVVASFAEAGRLPFDLSECEQELVGGYHTEYSGMKLMMYLVAEFIHMVTAAFLIVILYFGGWHLWGVTGGQEVAAWPMALLRIAILLAKVAAVILFFMLARWSWPRFRFDQLMDVAWKVMLPWGLANVVLVAAWLQYGGPIAAALKVSNTVAMAVLGLAALVASWLTVTLIDPTAKTGRERWTIIACRQAEEDPVDEAEDPNVRWVKEPELGLAGKSYLLLFAEGMTTTIKHLLGRKQTVQFPEEPHEIPDPLIYRGVHRLNRDEQGRVKCVACFLCATACPAHCIDIVAAESPWPDREKYPQSFTIDELRCIFCGMCEEACPVDAIELTSLYDLTGKSREEMIFDKEKLLSVYDQTKDKEPTRSARMAAEPGDAP